MSTFAVADVGVIHSISASLRAKFFAIVKALPPDALEQEATSVT